MAKAELWRNRIIGSAEVAPDSLLAHPSNWRGHPANQQNALTDILGGDDGVGWLDTVMVNKRTSELWPEGDRNVETVVDGHLRVALAMRHNQPTVPVRYVDLTPAEEALALATFDPIGALAPANAEQLDAVLREVQTGSGAVGQMLAELAEAGIAPLILGYQAFDKDIRIAGVILNKLGGSRHEAKLRQVIEHYTEVPVVGAIQYDEHLGIIERHLGLMPSNELIAAGAKIKQIGESGADAETLKKASILGALSLYLDSIHLFLFLLRIFGSAR